MQQSSEETPLESTGLWSCGSMVGGGISNAFRSWNLVSTRFSVPVRVRFWGKARALSGIPHVSGLVAAAAVDVIQSDGTQNFLGT